MSRIKRERHHEKEIMITDFSDYNEGEMIKFVGEIRDLIIREQTPKYIIAIFNNKNHLTPNLMNYFKTEKLEAIPFIKKQAVLGFTEIQMWILKGYNLFAKRNIMAFRTKEAALKYLLDDQLS